MRVLALREMHPLPAAPPMGTDTVCTFWKVRLGLRSMSEKPQKVLPPLPRTFGILPQDAAEAATMPCLSFSNVPFKACTRQRSENAFVFCKQGWNLPHMGIPLIRSLNSLGNYPVQCFLQTRFGPLDWGSWPDIPYDSNRTLKNPSPAHYQFRCDPYIFRSLRFRFILRFERLDVLRF